MERIPPTTKSSANQPACPPMHQHMIGCSELQVISVRIEVYCYQISFSLFAKSYFYGNEQLCIKLFWFKRRLAGTEFIFSWKYNIAREKGLVELSLSPVAAMNYVCGMHSASHFLLSL